MNMRIKSLELRNFRGIEKFRLTPGDNCSVYGANGTGKTTLADAFRWLMSGTDNHGNQFEIKASPEDGGIEHTVTASLDIDGSEVTFRKVYRETYTKGKLTGHKTECFIDDLGVSKTPTSYKKVIEDIIPKETFEILSSVTCFTEKLHWTRRREVLSKVCGEKYGSVTDRKIIDANKKLIPLTSILKTRSLDDHQAFLKRKAADIKKESDDLYSRINENLLILDSYDLAGIEPAHEICLINETTKKIQICNERLLQAESGGELAQKQIELGYLEAEMMDLKNKHRAKINDDLCSWNDEKRKLTQDINNLHDEIVHLTNLKTEYQTKINNLNKCCDTLRKKYLIKHNETFNYESCEACPTCGQNIPVAQIEATRMKALQEFNISKSIALEEIQKEGIAGKNRVVTLEKMSTDCENAIKAKQSTIATYGQLQKETEETITTMSSSIDNFTSEDAKYLELSKTYQDLTKSISKLQQGQKADIETIKQMLATLEADRKTSQDKLDRLDKSQATQVRISDLELETKELGKELEKIQQGLCLCETFLDKKSKIIEEQANNLFNLVQFKLFDKKINGNIEQCCTVQGINNVRAWTDWVNLSNGEKISCGLDICKSLSKHYGLSVPIIVDNSEGVTKGLDAPGQIIKMIASKADKTLRVVNNEDVTKPDTKATTPKQTTL